MTLTLGFEAGHSLHIVAMSSICQRGFNSWHVLHSRVLVWSCVILQWWTIKTLMDKGTRFKKGAIGMFACAYSLDSRD